MSRLRGKCLGVLLVGLPWLVAMKAFDDATDRYLEAFTRLRHRAECRLMPILEAMKRD